jgi:hypothetical protein
VRGNVISAWFGVLVLWWQLHAALGESGKVPAGIYFWSRDRGAGRHRRTVADRSADAHTGDSADA